DSLVSFLYSSRARPPALFPYTTLFRSAIPVRRLWPSRQADRRADDPGDGLPPLLAPRRDAESFPDLPDRRPEHESRPRREGARARPPLGPRVRRRRLGQPADQRAARGRSVRLG